MVEQTPNEKLAHGDGAALVAAQEKARGTYSPRVAWGTVAKPSPQKSTVSPFRTKG